ncbi:hypothetical protein [Wolbachia endosymbiont of Ctenocephalides felis wCfeJ]|uniref:hypothetical protein n=1 Tax=Wolbachia endosymbiont of Ctenocephalides felis wCfeJ TaxID=2732594 RepID=UPI0014475A3B|nr:hypothetical protein [Wolbachia endosymbiont of Ctenocephalides felis wCfeJ]
MYGKWCYPSSLYDVIKVAGTGIHSFFYWIPASRAGITPFDENKKPLIFDSV